MNKTRFAAKALAGAIATAVLVVGSLAASAQAEAKDTGWPKGSVQAKAQTQKDTGWPM